MKSRHILLYLAGSLLAAALLALWGCQPHSAVRLTPAATAQSGPQTGIFADQLPASGIDFHIHQQKSPITILESVGHGAGVIDYDGDGLLDLVFLGSNQIKIYHNDGNWHFRDVTASMGLRQEGYWQGLAVGDYDNDGHPDLYVCGYGCSALYHNEHGHRFREVTQEAGLQANPPDKDGNADWRTSAAFVDVDNDGRLDLYVCRYAKFGPKTIQLCGDPGKKLSCSPEMYKGQIGSLYINLGGGHFRDETQARGLSTASGRGLGVAVADYNEDGNIDIALANDELPGNLFKGIGKGRFQDVSRESGTAYDSTGKTHGGMGIDWGDFDGDGKLDLFVTTYENETKTLYRHIQTDMFMDVSQIANLVQPTSLWVGWGTKFLDYDRDGHLDLFMTSGHVMDNIAILGKGGLYAQPIQLFHNEGNRFTEVSKEAGPAFLSNLVGRAACLADIDNDGRQDLIVSNIEGKPLLLRNVYESPNHWLGLQLVGKQSNRMGLGAEVRADLGGHKLVRICTTTGSVLSASDPRVYFGLGAHTTVPRLTIRWPSGKTDTFANVPVDRYLIATEGEKALVPAAYNGLASARSE